MKRIFLLFSVVLFISQSGISQQNDISTLRRKYMTALHDIDKAPPVYEIFLNVKKPSAIILAYKGALEAILTKTTWNPFRRISYLNACEESFDKAIQMAPNDIEIRFMRLAVEHNIPHYLGYSEHLDLDKKFILENLANFYPYHIDQEILDGIVEFVKVSGRFSRNEILQFEMRLASNNSKSY